MSAFSAGEKLMRSAIGAAAIAVCFVLFDLFLHGAVEKDFALAAIAYGCGIWCGMSEGRP